MIKDTELIELWRTILITQEPPEDPPLLFINGTPIATPANYSLITGKKKTRKTLLIVHLISTYKGDLEKDVLIFDCEQGKRHVWQIRDKIKQLTGKDVPVFFLRGQSPEMRKDIIQGTLEFWPTKPKIIIVDGIRDLMLDINSPDETTRLIVWLESLIVKYSVHVINVLHTNKADQNARGHIGSELTNKGETTIIIEKDHQTGFSRVHCESSRDEPFSEFVFSHDETGLPKIIEGEKIKGEQMSDAEMRERLKYVFDGELLHFTQVVDGIKMHFGVGKTNAEQLHARFMRKGWVMRNGKPHAKDTVYKLL